MKETKRKGFNFFRSYFDVYNELESDKDKVQFVDALLNKQFLGIEPDNLKGMSKFAYVSQFHSIDTQVKGWEAKTGLKLTPTEGGRQGGVSTPTLQVEEEGKGKEEGKGEGEKVYSKEVNDCFNNCLNFFPEHLHPKNKESWLDTIEKLNRIDNIPLNHIERIVDLIKKDDFWSKNFLALPKLRKKNKDGLMYVIVFSEHLKSKNNGTTKKTRRQLFEEKLAGQLDSNE